MAMTTDRNATRPPTKVDDYDAIVPDELLAASHRRAASRARASRTLDRSVMRRRLLPTAMVTSVALIGTGLANAFVGATVPAATSTTTTTVEPYVARQSALNAQELARLSTTLANDRRVVADLTSTAQNTSATASSISASIGASIAAASAAAASAVSRASAAAAPTTTSAGATTSSVGAGTPSSASSGASPSTSAGASAAPAPTPVTTPTPAPAPAAPAPPTTTTVPAPPPPPPAPAPVTQATTGASGAG